MSAIINVNGTEYTLDQSVSDARDTISMALSRGNGLAEVKVRFGGSRDVPLLIRVEGVHTVAVHERAAASIR